METSCWIEEATHARTGLKKLFQADTEEMLEQQIAAWKKDVDEAAAVPADRVAQGPS